LFSEESGELSVKQVEKKKDFLKSLTFEWKDFMYGMELYVHEHSGC